MALDEKYLRDLADNSLGPEWESLATQLDFSSANIFRIRHDNQGSVSNQIFNMLMQWRQKLGGSENEACQILIDGLKQVGRNDLAGEVQERRERCPQPHQGNGTAESDGHILVEYTPSPETSSQEFQKPAGSYSVNMPGIQIKNMTVSSKDSPVFIGNVKNSVLNFGSNKF